MESALVSVTLSLRNILGIMLQLKYCEIQIFLNLTLNLIVTEGSFQHTARAGVPHIISLQDLFLQLFQFHIFVLRFVVNSASILFYNSAIACLGYAFGFYYCLYYIIFLCFLTQAVFKCLIHLLWINLIWPDNFNLCHICLIWKTVQYCCMKLNSVIFF